MFEIRQHIDSGQRYLVVVRDGRVSVAAGPLWPHEDAAHVLQTHGNQRHNPRALLDIRRHPAAYQREYTTDKAGRVVHVSEPRAASG